MSEYQKYPGEQSKHSKDQSASKDNTNERAGERSLMSQRKDNVDYAAVVKTVRPAPDSKRPKTLKVHSSPVPRSKKKNSIQFGKQDSVKKWRKRKRKQSRKNKDKKPVVSTLLGDADFLERKDNTESSDSDADYEQFQDDTNTVVEIPKEVEKRRTCTMCCIKMAYYVAVLLSVTLVMMCICFYASETLSDLVPSSIVENVGKLIPNLVDQFESLWFSTPTGRMIKIMKDVADLITEVGKLGNFTMSYKDDL